MKPRVLIVMTTPYSTSDSSRTLDAYFHFWSRDKVAQIFTRNWIPSKGHCEQLYQITDERLLKKWFNPNFIVGKLYHYEDLENQKGNNVIDTNSIINIGYKIGSLHSPFIELFRRMLWKKNKWCTEQLNSWLDDYKPEVIVWNFSNHLFTQPIVMYIADRYNIPVVAIIGDDYYFGNKNKLSISSKIYNKMFKKYTEKILLDHCSSAVYCSDKIKELYNNYFKMNGETVYFTSEIKRRRFRAINKSHPKIVYFGSIRLGRNNSLISLANTLGKIDESYKLEVYSNELDEHLYKPLKENENVYYGGSIPYEEVVNKINDCDIYVIVEGFEKENIELTKYSLSTKAADGLASGASILTYGPSDCGVISYLDSTNASVVCTNPSDLQKKIEQLLEDQDLQRLIYENAVKATKANHTLEKSTKTFENVVEKVLEKKERV